MKELSLYTCGRCVVNGQWQIDSSRILNRLYYVNSGSATIFNGISEHRLTSGRFYIIPQCKSFQPIEAVGFDHTYFDFYSSRIFRPNKIIDLEGSILDASSFFKHVNSFINKENGKTIAEHYLSGFLALIEAEYDSLYYISDSSITRALNLIHSEYKSVTTKDLAKMLNLNESYFIRLFTSTMGTSPMKYIRAVKVAHAKEFIRNGESITKTAELCGYASPASFYNAVKSELGISPSEFKR